MSAWKHQELSYDLIVTKALRENRQWEIRKPIPRLRHNQEAKLVHHRFPIKNGLTMAEALAWMSQQSSGLLTRLLSAKLYSTEPPISENICADDGQPRS